MKRFLVLILIVAVTGCGAVAPAAPSALSQICVIDTFWEQRRLSVPEIPDDFGPRQADPEQLAVAKEPEPRLILFTDPSWCAPCLEQETYLEALRKWDKAGYWTMGPESTNQIQILDDEDPAMAKYGVDAVPTWVRVRYNGDYTTHEGPMTKEQIVSFQRGPLK
jgi:hypothetical protein